MGVGPERIAVVGIESGADKHCAATRSVGVIERYSYTKHAVLEILTLNNLTPVKRLARLSLGPLWPPWPLWTS